MNRLRTSSLLLALPLLLASCTMAPKYERPPMPVADSFPGGTAAPAPDAAPPPPARDVPWQEYFTDPKLKSVIDLALANNRDLRVATLNVEKAALLTSALESHASSFRDTITRQAMDLDESVMNGINGCSSLSASCVWKAATMDALVGVVGTLPCRIFCRASRGQE